MQEYFKKKVKYKINGFVGTCMAYSVYDDGRTLLFLEGIDTTGRPIEYWIDINYSEVIEE